MTAAISNIVYFCRLLQWCLLDKDVHWLHACTHTALCLWDLYIG